MLVQGILVNEVLRDVEDIARRGSDAAVMIWENAGADP